MRLHEPVEPDSWVDQARVPAPVTGRGCAFVSHDADVLHPRGTSSGLRERIEVSAPLDLAALAMTGR